MSHVRLLVSVRNGSEATEALQGGADIIDAKEPDNGALGAVSDNALHSITKAVGSDRTLSVACGELLESEGKPFSSKTCDPAGELEGAAIRYRKFGLAGAAKVDWQSKAVARLANGMQSQLVLVAYADFERVAAPDPRDVLAWVVRQPNVNLLVDTAAKDGTSLFDWMDEKNIAELVDTSKRHGTTIGLAGSLRGEAFDRAVAMEPDIVGVRGAACENADRSSRVSETRVRELVQVVAGFNATRTARQAM